MNRRSPTGHRCVQFLRRMQTRSLRNAIRTCEYPSIMETRIPSSNHKPSTPPDYLPPPLHPPLHLFDTLPLSSVGLSPVLQGHGAAMDPEKSRQNRCRHPREFNRRQRAGTFRGRLRGGGRGAGGKGEKGQYLKVTGRDRRVHSSLEQRSESRRGNDCSLALTTPRFTTADETLEGNVDPPLPTGSPGNHRRACVFLLTAGSPTRHLERDEASQKS